MEEDEEMEEDSTSNVVEGHGTLITDTGNGTVKEDLLVYLEEENCCCEGSVYLKNLIEIVFSLSTVVYRQSSSSRN